jgi:hypothetical protein
MSKLVNLDHAGKGKKCFMNGVTPWLQARMFKMEKIKLRFFSPKLLNFSIFLRWTLRSGLDCFCLLYLFSYIQRKSVAVIEKKFEKLTKRKHSQKVNSFSALSKAETVLSLFIIKFLEKDRPRDHLSYPGKFANKLWNWPRVFTFSRESIYNWWSRKVEDRRTTHFEQLSSWNVRHKREVATIFFPRNFNHSSSQCCYFKGGPAHF